MRNGSMFPTGACGDIQVRYDAEVPGIWCLTIPEVKSSDGRNKVSAVEKRPAAPFLKLQGYGYQLARLFFCMLE